MPEAFWKSRLLPHLIKYIDFFAYVSLLLYKKVKKDYLETLRFQKSKKIFFYKYRRLQKKKWSINSMKINTDFISKNNTYERNTPEYIVVHNTDNFAEGADAHAHALAQCRKNFQDMSAHYYVDDKEIIYQAADICRGCWHVGIDYGGELFGIVNNRNSIGIEMCVQKGYDFEKAFENTVLLVKYLMNRTGIKADRVVQHYDVCLKNCPSEIRRQGAWERLKSDIEKEILIPKTGTYRITAKVLNIRSGPGRQYTIVGEVHFGEAYTIVQTENNCWGKLLSGAGWICLNYAEQIK